ncbi:DNA-binding response regulator [Oscillatoria laete-virens NRMC-F 0139]|nr:DNA-binding response regulator [Oscillatoria laete-virens]MDL5055701.1 DNA-binding response regulator [Oscillatoria laete-virens NRMC-F 0139]
MGLNILVVEDDPEILKIVRPKFVALRAKVTEAMSLQAARKCHDASKPDLLLLDLKIPADDEGDLPDMQYGLIFLREMRTLWSQRQLPIIAMTSYADEAFEHTVELTELGINGAIKKTDIHAKLVPVVKQVLAKVASAPLDSNAAKKARSTATRKFAGGKLTFFKDRVELFDCRICGEAPSLKRKVLDALCERKSSGAFRGKGSGRLDEEIRPDGGQGSINGAVRDIRKDIVAALAEEGIECERESVIQTSREGFRFREWIEVCVLDYGTPVASIEEKPKDALAAERQDWMLQLLKKSDKLRIPMVTERFGCDERTARRDIEVLREKHDIVFEGSPKTGYYKLDK